MKTRVIQDEPEPKEAVPAKPEVGQDAGNGQVAVEPSDPEPESNGGTP